MVRRVHFAARAADLARFEADVIGLYYQGHFSDATMHVARAMGLSNRSLENELWEVGESFGMDGDGKIGARFVLFLRVPPPAVFTYQHVRQFNDDILRLLRMYRNNARHIALPTHGVGGDDNLAESLTAIVRGCGDAIKAGDIPDALETITIVDRRFDDAAAIKRIFQDLMPEGGLVVPGHAPAPLAVASADVGRPSLYDIFISYKSEDEQVAAAVYDALTRNGLRVFYSRETLPALGSSEYHEQIDQALEHARHMVVVTTSRERVMARWVQYEWRGFMGEQLNGRKSGNLLTVIGGDMTIDQLPISLRHREVLRCNDEGLERLIQFTRLDVDRRSAEAKVAIPVPVAAPAPALAKAERAAEHTAVRVGDLMVAADDVLWNTMWEDALDHLKASREVDASRGWRMPTLDELRAIRAQGVLPQDACYWSGEEASESHAFFLDFFDDEIIEGRKSVPTGVSAVFVRRR